MSSDISSPKKEANVQGSLCPGTLAPQKGCLCPRQQVSWGANVLPSGANVLGGANVLQPDLTGPAKILNPKFPK